MVYDHEKLEPNLEGTGWPNRRHRLLDEAAGRDPVHLLRRTTPNSLALKLTCTIGDQGQLTYRVGETVDSTMIGLEALPFRPWWVTESVVDDAIWSSRDALSWLAGGRPVTVIRQPELKANKDKRYLLPDFALVPHSDDQPVCLVELEKDGRSCARHQLQEQLAFGRMHSYFGEGERVTLLGVDTRGTWRETDIDEDHLQAYWHLARTDGDASALWLVLGRVPEANFSARRKAVSWNVHPGAEDLFLNVEVPHQREQIDALGPNGIIPTAIVKLSFHTKSHSQSRMQDGRPTCCHPGYMMKFARHWLGELAGHLAEKQELAKHSGDWHWRLDFGTGRGNTANKARLYLYFNNVDGVDAAMNPLAAALKAFWTSEREASWAEQVRRWQALNMRAAPPVPGPGTIAGVP